MLPFTLCIPTKIVFGPGVSCDISAHIDGMGKHALLVSYGARPYLKTLLQQIRASLYKVGIRYTEFFEITANPHLSQVKRAVALCREKQIDMVIGIGGGSVMDAAKAIAAGACYTGDLWEMFSSRNDHNVARPPTQALKTVMIPTVAATSSEMNCVGVVTNDDTMEKVHVSAPCLYPALSVMDPVLTCTLPFSKTAPGAVDAMSHILEAYVNGDQNSPLQDGLHESLLRTLMSELRALRETPDDLSHRTNLQWAATMAWNGWIQAGTAPRTPMHKMGHAVSAMYDVTHGVTLAIFMNGYLHDICTKTERIARRFAQLGKQLFGEKLIQEQVRLRREQAETSILSKEQPDLYLAARICVDLLTSFFVENGVPVTLRQAGVENPDLEALCALIMRVGAAADGRIAGLVPVGRDDMMRILHAVKA